MTPQQKAAIVKASGMVLMGLSELLNVDPPLDPGVIQPVTNDLVTSVTDLLGLLRGTTTPPPPPPPAGGARR